MSELLSDLNEEQLSALNEPGHVLLVACPGSGKTRTLVHKVAEELSQVEGHRQFVVALTYTHVAADEIRARIEAMGLETKQLWVGTIHSFCLEWILKPYSIYHSALRGGYAVLDTFMQEELLDEVAKRNGLKSRFDCKYFATADGYEIDATTPSFKRKKVEATIDEYYRILNEQNFIDFEMMLKYSYDLITSHAPIAGRLAKMFQFISVDEYQDTRMIQYQILACIFQVPDSDTRLFMVGDPNQAIFTSLGGVALSSGELEALMGIKVTAKKLSRNYRSSQQIVDYFSRYEVESSEISAVGNYRDFSGSVTYNQSVQFRDELFDYIANLIRHHVEVMGIAPEEICVVAPWWNHLSPLTRALAERLPGHDFNGPGLSPFGENRDNFWYKVARIALSEPSPRRYVSRVNWAQEVLDLLFERGHGTDHLEARDFLRISNGIKIEASTGPDYLEQFFAELMLQLRVELREDEEIAIQREYFFERMQNRIQRIAGKENIDISGLQTFRQVFRSKTGTVLSTIHGVKGEEYDTVIAFALLQDALPHFNEQNKAAAAKRALFVVGSRARKHLHLISESNRPTAFGDIYSPTKILANAQYPYSRELVVA